MSDVAEAVTARVAEVARVPAGQVRLEHRIVEVEGMDSARLVQVVSWCERRWGVELDEEELFDVDTVGDLCALVERALVA